MPCTLGSLRWRPSGLPPADKLTMDGIPQHEASSRYPTATENSVDFIGSSGRYSLRIPKYPGPTETLQVAIGAMAIASCPSNFRRRSEQRPSFPPSNSRPPLMRPHPVASGCFWGEKLSTIHGQGSTRPTSKWLLREGT